ncbi:tetratricopeptide repeat protein [Spartinivicinus poritis]|uniref:Tetratricopeptide repeat protein n=1 Tax=Spartinivicinus poritis TaxID=2994640 RepID=A0ABT5UBG7_9GAMM|nr:hypothetical protein [Spartinivicinus sp. A2-2]MDE1463667.1 hypothetical protein [Spartinivicinus sp. A2-2]
MVKQAISLWNRFGIRYRTVVLFFLLTTTGVLLVGCASHRINQELDFAYQHYDNGNCVGALHSLSRVDRMIRSQPRRFLQPEVSMLRGLCLERQGLYMDAIETYRFIQQTYPQSEYAYRAKARIRVLTGGKVGRSPYAK